MTSKLIRRLIDCGCSPDTASRICCVYIRDASLADLDSIISIVESNLLHINPPAECKSPRMQAEISFIDMPVMSAATEEVTYVANH